MSLLIDNKKIIFHLVMKPKSFGLTNSEANIEDMPEEYAVIKEDRAKAGIMVYAKYNGNWEANPFSTRFLIKHLLEIVLNRKL